MFFTAWKIDTFKFDPKSSRQAVPIYKTSTITFTAYFSIALMFVRFLFSIYFFMHA